MNHSLSKWGTTRWLVVLGLVCAGIGTSQVLTSMAAESEDKQAQDSPASLVTKADRINLQAVAELKKMTAFLDRNAGLVLKSRVTWEAIQESGMKLQFEADQEIGVREPNQLYSISKRNDGASRKVWYDRNTLTHLNVKDNTYVRLSVPETINEMLDQTLEKYDLPSPPMLDFLYTDSETSFLSGITDAIYVGECLQNGKKCHHLAFSTPAVDYQIWIPLEGKPLPVKYSITWMDEPLLPWFTAQFLDWNTEPSFSDGSFAASLPTGAKRNEVSRRAGTEK